MANQAAVLACIGAAALSVFFPRTVQATEPVLYVQYGTTGRSGGHSQGLGVTLPWRSWQYTLWGGVVRGHWDIWTARWHAKRHGSIPVIGASPVLRWQNGTSPWFIQAGLGISLGTSHRYATQHKQFSTRFNFASHIGGGRAFGAQQQHEWLLRLEHHSNASIKSPNPGENFLQLRYGYRF